MFELRCEGGEHGVWGRRTFLTETTACAEWGLDSRNQEDRAGARLCVDMRVLLCLSQLSMPRHVCEMQTENPSKTDPRSDGFGSEGLWILSFCPNPP